MRNRLRLLRENGVGIDEICRAISTLERFDGAVDFLARAKSLGHVVIVSDSFSPMSPPAMMTGQRYFQQFLTRPPRSAGKATGAALVAPAGDPGRVVFVEAW